MLFLNRKRNPRPPLHIQEQIINKINVLNNQSSHYETYAQMLQTEIDLIMETIRNMTQNQTLNKSKSKSGKNLDKLGLESIPDIEQLLSDTNDELEFGYKLLSRLNKYDFTNTESEPEIVSEIVPEIVPEEEVLAKVAKAKTSNKAKQMIARV